MFAVFRTVVAAGSMTTQCEGCGACDSPFLCGRCRAARFCSAACQRAAWPKHRGRCHGSPVVACHSAVDAPTSSCGSRLPASPSFATFKDWIGLVGHDAFPGQDAEVLPDDIEAVKRRCQEQGFGGFVTWNRRAFLRKQAPFELLAAKQRAQGCTLWLPAEALGRMPGEHGFSLPAELPEVIVLGAHLVDKCRGLSEADMTDRFIHSKPVVLTDAQTGWAAQDKWKFQWLEQHFGDDELPCSDLAPFFRSSDSGCIQTLKVSMREYVRYIAGQRNAIQSFQKSVEQPFYGNGWTPFLRHECLIRDVSDRLYCVTDCVPRGGDGAIETQLREFNLSLTKVFLGPAGTVSRLHHDTYATHVWLSQIRGRKQFICYPPGDSEHLHYVATDECDGKTSLFDPSNPDFETFPRARCATPFSVVVEEGETVVLPSRWWHWAKSLTPSITLMRNFVNDVNLQEYVRIRECVQGAKQSQNSMRVAA